MMGNGWVIVIEPNGSDASLCEEWMDANAESTNWRHGMQPYSGRHGLKAPGMLKWLRANGNYK